MSATRPTPERRTVAPEGMRAQGVPATRPMATAATGVPLRPGVRTFMEGRFGHDFSAVRVHPDVRPPADPGGRVPVAWTHGHDVFLHGHDADTPQGLALVAHELTHVVQQSHATEPDRGHDAPGERTRAENEAVTSASQAFDPAVPAVRPAAHQHGVGFSTVAAVLGGVAGAVVGGLLGALAGPLGAVVGAAAGAALGAWVAGSLTNDRGAGEGTASQRIHQLLSRTLTDWVVTDEDAAAALGILLQLEKTDPIELYQVLEQMKLGEDWDTLRSELAPELHEPFYALVQLKMSPNSGYVMPGDELRLTFLTRAGVPEQAKPQKGGTESQPEDLGKVTVVDRFAEPVKLGTRVEVAGLSLKAAADRLAQAYVDAGWYTSGLRVTLEPVRRGPLYSTIGEVTTPEKVEGSSRPLDAASQAKQDKRQRFRDHVPYTLFNNVVLDAAVSIYHREVEERLEQHDDPAQLWVWAKARAQARYDDLTRPTPAQRFLEVSRSQMALAAKMPEAERRRYQEANNRFIAWLDKHADDPKLATISPVEVWTRELMAVIRKDIHTKVKQEMDAAAEKRRDAALEKGAEKFGQAVELAERRIWPVTPTTSAFSSEEVVSETSGKVITKSWLITASPAEKVMRDLIASDFLRDSLDRLQRDPETYLKTDVKSDLVAYFNSNPDKLAALQLTVSRPVVESFEDEVDIPGWQHATEAVIGFIPFVGAAVGIAEALAGRDLFGHPLSTTERTIVGIGAALPGIFKTLKLGKEAFVASRVVSKYGLSGAEASRVYRMYTGLAPGSAGAKLFNWGYDEIKAGRRVADAKKLADMEAVLKELGMTEKSAARATQPAAQREIEQLAAQELQAVKLSSGPMSPETEKLLMGNDALRGALKENSLAAIVLKKCASPCFPEHATADQVRRLESLLERVSKTGPYDETALREYLYKRRELLDSAIYDLGVVANTKRIQSGTAAKDLNAWLAFMNNPTKAIIKLDDPLVKLARRNLAHDIGVMGGQAQAAAEGLKVTEFVSPFRMGSHGQGLDDLAVEAAEGIEGVASKGVSFDQGLVYVLEHKGGEATLRKGQMELDWIVTNIQRLYREGGADGRKWARILAKALGEGRLRGRAYSTEVVKDAAGNTTLIKEWVYEARTVLLAP